MDDHEDSEDANGTQRQTEKVEEGGVGAYPGCTRHGHGVEGRARVARRGRAAGPRIAGAFWHNDDALQGLGGGARGGRPQSSKRVRQSQSPHSLLDFLPC